MKTYLLQKLAIIVSFLQQVTKNADRPFMWLAAFFGSGFTGLIGGYDAMVKVLIIFIAADYISGLVAASIEKGLSSKVGFRGIAKKLAIIMLVVLGHQADTLLGFSLLRNAIIFFYVANEIISILENVNRMGLDTPPILNQIIELLQKKANPSIPDTKPQGEEND